MTAELPVAGGLARSVRVAWVSAALLAIALAISLFFHVTRDKDDAFGVGPKGSVHAVMLTTQQVYYGSLEAVSDRSIVLKDVFYVTVNTDAQGSRTNKLVRRAETDWHGPTAMTVPVDKVVFIEPIGPNSAVAKLIQDARAKQP